MAMEIRITTDEDLHVILAVEQAAFGRQDVVDLTRDLLSDPSARPLISLLAYEDGRAVGHVLFTRARIEADNSPSAMILAPLAVIPEQQKKGVGGALIREGLRLAGEAGVELVFVLGHPTYYPRYGFEPAGRLGLNAPYPIPEKDAEAWMVQALRPGLLGEVRGCVACAEAMDSPEHWRE
jgi:putative acetyltransferase